MNKFIVISLVCILGCQPTTNSLEEILSEGSADFQRVLNAPQHEVQIIYGEIREDSIIHHTFQLDANKFFYPASTVKMLTAFAAVEKLNEYDLPLQTIIEIDSQQYHPYVMAYDSLFAGPITVENLLKKIFAYSDNQAYNILYRWLGKDYINQMHASKGLDTRIIHMLSERAFSFSSEANNYSYQVELNASDQTISETGKKQAFTSPLTPLEQIRGKGYIDKNGNLVAQPFDFSTKNFVPLASLLGSLERVVKPELFPAAQRYNWCGEQYVQVEAIMTMLPGELPSPIDTLPDNYVKFLLFGDQESEQIPAHIEIRNKVGWAYGYLTDIAYIRDHENQIEFFLAATIHVNENQVYNDGIYEYDSIGLPFLAELGRLIHQHELEKVY